MCCVMLVCCGREDLNSGTDACSHRRNMPLVIRVHIVCFAVHQCWWWLVMRFGEAQGCSGEDQCRVQTHRVYLARRRVRRSTGRVLAASLPFSSRPASCKDFHILLCWPVDWGVSSFGLRVNGEWSQIWRFSESWKTVLSSWGTVKMDTALSDRCRRRHGG
jgi:hypothetical protein